MYNSPKVDGTPCSGLLLTFKLFSSLNHAGGGVGEEGAGLRCWSFFSKNMILIFLGDC